MMRPRSVAVPPRSCRNVTPSGPDPFAVRPLASLGQPNRADTTTVRWRHGLVATVDTPVNVSSCDLPDRMMTFPASCADAVQALHRGLVADASALPGLDRADGDGADPQTSAGGRRRAGRPDRRATATMPLSGTVQLSRWRAMTRCTARRRRGRHGCCSNCPAAGDLRRFSSRRPHRSRSSGARSFAA